MNRTSRKLQRGVIFIVTFLLMIFVSYTCFAEDASPPLRVGVSPFTPFVIFKNAEIEGYSIDLWNQVAKELGVEYRFVKSGGVSEKLVQLMDRRIDVAIGGISITEERERRIDFTHSYFHTGLGILVQKRSSASIGQLLRTFLTKKRLTIIGSFLLLVFMAGNIIWLVERKQDAGKRSFALRYLPGIFEGMYWAVVTASTVGYGDRTPQTWVGRLLAILLIITFLPFFAFFIAKLSADITLYELHTAIDGPNDLIDKRVGVVQGTTSYDYMSHLNAAVFSFERVEKAYELLISGELDAIVYDRPHLLYFAQTKGRGKVEVVGKVFAPQDYGVATLQGSELREGINRAILSIIEKGQMDEIQTKWFGAQSTRRRHSTPP